MNLEKAYDLIAGKLSNWFEAFVKLLPNLALATLVMVIGFFIAKFIKNFSLKMIRKVSHLETINRLFASFIYILVLGVTLFTALDILNLDKAVTTALAGAGILGLALAFAFQDIAANFMSGIFMSFRHPFNVGDLVKIGAYKGRIEAINLRDTALISLQGQKIIIPNKQVFQNPIENYSSTGIRRLDLKGRVSLTEDLEKAKEITIKAVENLSERDPQKDIEFFYDEFSDSAITFDLRIWMQDPEQKKYMSARDNAVIAITKAYHEANIVIPFPIHTLNLGDKSEEIHNETNIVTGKDPNKY